MSFYSRTDTELLELLINLQEKLGKWPTFDDVKNIAEILPEDAPDGLPNNIFATKFGSLDRAIEKARLREFKKHEGDMPSEDGAVFVKKGSEMSSNELKGSERLLNELKSESKEDSPKAEKKPKDWISLGEIPFTFMDAKIETFKGTGGKGSRGMMRITYDDSFVFEQKVFRGKNVITLRC